MSDEDRLNRAAEAMDNGEYRAAALDAREVLQKNPDNVTARLLLGKAAVALDDGASAEKELRRALSLGARPDELMTYLAQSLLLQGKFAVVIAEIDVGSATTEVDRIALMRSRADAYNGVGQPIVARDLYMDVLAFDAEDLDALLGIVNTYIAEENLIQARETLSQILSSHGNSTAVRISSGSLYYSTQNFELAEREFKTALELVEQESDRRNEITVWTGLAEVRLADNRIDAAREAVDRLLVLAPKAIATAYFDARIAYMDKDLPRALERLQQVLVASPEYWPAQMLLGAVHLESGNLGQAEMYLSAVVAAVPSNTGARKLLADARLRLNMAEGAKEILAPILDDYGTDASTLGMAARASAESGDVDEAVGYLRRAVELDPGNSDLVLDLVGVLIAARKMDEARVALESIPDTSEHSEYRRELLGILVDLGQGDTASALSTAAKMLSRNPDDPQLLNLVGNINLSSGQVEAAREHFVRVQNLRPDETSSQLNLARIAASEGKRGEAVAWLESARAADANAVAPRITLGRLYLARKEFGAAEIVAQEALEVQDSIAELHNILGQAQRGQGEHADSLRSFSRATKLEPGNLEFRLNLAKAHISTANHGLARAVLEDSYKQDPAHLDSGVLLAALAARMGSGDMAMTIAKELQRNNAESHVPFVLEGELLAGGKYYQQAAQAYDAALMRVSDRETVVRAYRLKVLANSDNPQTSLVDYLESQPGDNDVRLILAQEYERNDDFEKAVEEYEMVVQSSQGNVVALNNLAIVYMKAGDARAVDAARRAHAVAPDNGTVADTLGWILTNHGFLDEGVEVLRRADTLAGGRAEIRYHLAAALAKSGEEGEARVLLEQVLSIDETFASRDEAQRLLLQLQEESRGE